ncbi:MAG: ABC transporter substrate-binding protein [Phyllobacteriaceae bacterium]|nr:ABC transporter substrate-binding protein [Phyllobacteriaceae bacterium]
MLKIAAALIAVLAASTAAFAADPDPANWPAVLEDARGETVYFNAWAAPRTSMPTAWVGDEVEQRFGVKLVHVKLEDTATAVNSVLAEKTAGRTEDGKIDLIWINGENFSAMKRQGLLLAPGWAEKLPNYAYADVEGKPTLRSDFTIPVDGQESPWGMAKLVFFHDSARTKPEEMPKSIAELVAWANAHPGRFAYPQPPDFMGSTFLKQVLAESVADRAVLAKDASSVDASAVLAPVFATLDALNPNLWRAGKAFPKNYPALKQLLADNEADIIFAFNPAEASSAIAAGELPDTVRSFVFPGGTLANSHFVAVPFNASSKAGAFVVADFLLSPEAQARKQDPKIWGDPTVLAMAKLSAEDRARFDALDLGVATLAPDALGPAIGEPHPSWMTTLEAEWTRRYGVAN